LYIHKNKALPDSLSRRALLLNYQIFYFFSILHPPFNPNINQAREIVPNAKIVSPITLSHLKVTRYG
jgi:hypothetical protein